jgi:uncharacterized membrane protein
MTWILFSLIAATCWAIVQLVDKTLIETEAPSSNQYLFVTGLASVPVVIFGLTVIGYQGSITTRVIILSVVAGICYFVANAFFFYSLNLLDASVAAASVAIVPAGAALAAWLILGQVVGRMPLIGIALITLGIATMGAQRGGVVSSQNVWSAWAALIAANALLIAEYVIEGYAVGDANPAVVFYWTRVGVVLATFFFMILRFTEARKAMRWLIYRKRKVGALSLGNEALDMLAISCLLVAYAHGPVGLATSVAYANPVLVYLFTLSINHLNPGTVPSDGDVKYRTQRIGGLVIIVSGVVLAGL